MFYAHANNFFDLNIKRKCEKYQNIYTMILIITLKPSVKVQENLKCNFFFNLFQGQKLNNEKTKNTLIQQLNKFFYIGGKIIFLQFKNL
jgi:hypothetical protein